MDESTMTDEEKKKLEDEKAAEGTDAAPVEETPATEADTTEEAAV